MMTLRQIEVVRAVMISGTISGAAKLLNVSAPGIYRLRLNDLGNPDAAPLPKDEYDRLRARTELDTGSQTPSLANG